MITNIQNPYGIITTKDMVVTQNMKATLEEAKAGIDDTKYMTPLTTKNSIDNNSKSGGSSNFTTYQKYRMGASRFELLADR